MTDSSGSPRLQVMRAVEDGWNAFTKSPWSFVLFVLLFWVLSAIFQAIANVVVVFAGNTSTTVQIIGLVVSWLGSTIISLWGVTGLIRGAWKALDGEKPNFSELIRLDGGAAGRLFINQLVLALILGIIVSLSLVISGQVAQLNEALVFIPAITAAVVFIYLAVNQKFLPWIALIQDGNPFDTIQSGRSGVDPSWWSVVLLLIIEALILLVGLILCCVGLLAAFPVVICISTAAYRQIFGSEDSTGFLS